MKNGKVKTIAVLNCKLCSIKIGTKLSRIKKTLGAPNYEGMAHEGDEFHEGRWIISYNRGNYTITFAAKGKDEKSLYGELDLIIQGKNESDDKK
jgi:hypothetical protein